MTSKKREKWQNYPLVCAFPPPHPRIICAPCTGKMHVMMIYGGSNMLVFWIGLLADKIYLELVQQGSYNISRQWRLAAIKY